MAKTKTRLIQIIYWTVIICTDILIFMILGLLLMVYDDNYDSSKGEYWSLASMNATEKTIYICFNAWIIINIIGAVYVVWKVYKRTKNYGT